MNQERKAEIILSSRAVFTGLDEGPIPRAIAIVGQKIAAVGTEQEIESWAGPDTKWYRFEDQLIVPGFHDFHMHLMLGSFIENSLNLSKARSEEEAVEMVRAYAESRPDVSWIIGIGWDSGYWPDQQLPHRKSLDQVLPDRPVLLLHAETHYAWANSKALALGGINRETKEPAYGGIGKDEDGEPNGILYEWAISMLTEPAWDLQREERIRLLRGFLQQAVRYGVTSVNDLHSNGSRTLNGHQNLALFKEFEAAGELNVRIHFATALQEDLGEALALRETYSTGKVSFSGLKQFLDGAITSMTAYMVEPYCDKGKDRGSTPFPPDTIKKWVAAADREGFQVRFHAIGDAAVRLALDAFEHAANENGPRDSRHCVEHVEVVHPDDIHRFQQLGVIASIQPEHIVTNERSIFSALLGEERLALYSPIGTLRGSGGVVAFGTDYPVVTLNPLLGIYTAMTRVGSDGLPWNEQECLSLAEALRAYTSAPAYGSFRERELGTIEQGKLADLVVLDRNLFNSPVAEIPRANVLLTMLDGQVVFEGSQEEEEVR
ncbi:UNVERIFIED_CONTAM: putative amidohydrolase YtcJ [Brevibacillus sp. OAP136]